MPAAPPAPVRPRAAAAGFTLVELLVAMTILSIVMVAIVMSMQGVQNAWRQTRSAVREHMEGRRALETVVTHLARATLHTRWVPNNDLLANPAAVPTALVAESDLHFVCGPARTLLPAIRASSGHAVFFQGAFGFPGSSVTTLDNPDAPLYQTLPHALSAWGYYVEFGRDPVELPSFLSSTRQGRPPPPRKHRFRLMEYRQPAHELSLLLQPRESASPLLAQQSNLATLYDWFQEPVFRSQPGGLATERRVEIVAENILALVIVPHEPQLGVLRAGESDSNTPYWIAPDYHFDSRRHQWQSGSALAAATRHQLPPVVEIAVVALSEDDWENLSEGEAIHQGEALVSFMSSLFLSAANFNNDLRLLDEELSRRRLGHQIMTQVVLLNGQAGRLAPPAGVLPASSTAAAP